MFWLIILAACGVLGWIMCEDACRDYRQALRPWVHVGLVCQVTVVPLFGGAVVLIEKIAGFDAVPPPVRILGGLLFMWGLVSVAALIGSTLDVRAAASGEQVARETVGSRPVTGWAASPGPTARPIPRAVAMAGAGTATSPMGEASTTVTARPEGPRVIERFDRAPDGAGLIWAGINIEYPPIPDATEMADFLDRLLRERGVLPPLSDEEWWRSLDDEELGEEPPWPGR